MYAKCLQTRDLRKVSRTFEREISAFFPWRIPSHLVAIIAAVLARGVSQFTAGKIRDCGLVVVVVGSRDAIIHV